MKKLEKMITAYNKKAEKWGFSKIEVVNGKITEDFVEKPYDGLPFFAFMKVAYQNGYLKEDYEKIEKRLSLLKDEAQ